METTDIIIVEGAVLPENVFKEYTNILFINKFDYKANKLHILRSILIKDSFTALNLYANIQNPESILISGKTENELLKELDLFYKNINDKKWLNELKDCL